MTQPRIDKTLTLHDGRRLGYAEYGDAAGARDAWRLTRMARRLGSKLRLERCRLRGLSPLLAGLIVAIIVTGCSSTGTSGPATTAPSGSGSVVSPSTSAPTRSSSPTSGSTTTSAASATPVETTSAYLAQLDLNKIMADGVDYASIASEAQVDAQAVVQQLLAKYENIDRTQVLKEVFKRLTAGAKTETDKEKAVLYFVQKLSVHDFDSPFMSLPIFDPLLLFDVHAMDCNKCSRLIADLYSAAGYESRLVDMYGHMVAEVNYEGGWHYADADLFGGGQVVTMPDGHIPSMAELSQNYQLLDRLQPYLEMNILFSYGASGKGPSYWTYPSYSYFSAIYFAKNAGYPHYLYKNPTPAASSNRTLEQVMMFGWDESTAEVRREPASDIKLSDIPETATPNVPQITGVSVSSSSVVLSFSDTDPEGTIGGYTVFVSKTSRGWDYGSFTGAAAAKQYWANPGGWTSSMYDNLFTVPPHAMAELETKADAITVPQLAPGRYFISVMARDAYGDSVDKGLYPLSNEIAVSIP